MDEKILDLYDEYAKGSLDRRDFIKKLAALAGGTAAALTLLPFLEGSYAKAQVVAKDDPRLHVEDIKYPAETGEMLGHYAKPKGDKRLPGVIVIHENRGLNPHTKDVARRVALEGFLAVAPDACSPLGGTPEDVDAARAKMREISYSSSTTNAIGLSMFPSCTEPRLLLMFFSFVYLLFGARRH